MRVHGRRAQFPRDPLQELRRHVLPDMILDVLKMTTYFILECVREVPGDCAASTASKDRELIALAVLLRRNGSQAPKAQLLSE